jgi:hypothetical protein
MIIPEDRSADETVVFVRPAYPRPDDTVVIRPLSDETVTVSRPDDTVVLPVDTWWPFLRQERPPASPSTTTAEPRTPPRRGTGAVYARCRRWLPRLRRTREEVSFVVTLLKITVFWCARLLLVMLLLLCFVTSW